MRIALIAAMARNRVIGAGNDLPWRLPDDLKHFKAVTLGKPVVMGRRTLESLPGLLPGRTNVVVTRNPSYAAPGCVVVSSLEEALQRYADVDELIVAGGGEIFAQALPRADRLYLTLVDHEVEGDALFPEVDWTSWYDAEEPREHPADARHPWPFTIRVLDRLS